MEKTDFISLLSKIPKTELHVHIEAVITIESVRRLYEKRFGKKITSEEENQLFDYNDLPGFIGAFLKVQDLFTDVSDFDLVFDDFGNYLKENNIVYCEAFFAPSAFVKKGFSYKEMIANFSKNIEKIQTEKNITIKMLIDVSRTFGEKNAEENYNLFKENPSKYLIGIGLGGNEVKGPCKLFSNVFEKAHKDGFHAVAHAGEDVGPESIWDAIKDLHAERIGHGVTAIQDANLISYLKEKQIPLEICPTSNVFTKKITKSIETHPLRKFFTEGLLVTINTDDPVFFKTTLLNEYWEIYSKLNFTLPEIKMLIENGFKAAFLSDSEKEKYLETVESAWKKNVEESSKDD